MSEPTKEYLIAKATLCRDLAVKQIVAGEGEQAARNLMRMVKALGEVGIINEREDKTMSYVQEMTQECDYCGAVKGEVCSTKCEREGESNE